MSYQYPPNNQVDFSWVGFDEYTYPDSTSADFSWYKKYSCHYIAPTSPNIDFWLDGPGYVPPSGSQTDFHLICDDEPTGTVIGYGSYTFPAVASESFIFVSVAGFGNSEFTAVESTSVIDLGNWGRSNVHIESPIASNGYAVMAPIVMAAVNDIGDMTISSQSGIITATVWGRSNARIRSPIVSNGYAEMTPIVMDAVNDIGDMTISSQSGIITAAVYELGQNLQFTDAISHLRGRVIFGYPKANIIRQVYEMSNNRSLAIPSVPEDPCYAVFLTTTDFNLTDEELRRGTIDLAFTFDHDLKDIVRISVWLQSPSGHISLDKMRIVDYPGGNQDPHLLLDPFKYTSSYRIPIHCISKKENEFFIEIEYKNADASETGNRSRVMLEKENYRIPFQAHFDNRMPYLNIADHVMVDGPEASSNVYSLLESAEQFPAYCIPDSDVKDGIGQNANENTWYSQVYDEITRISLTPEDDVAYITHGGGNPNTYFIQEYVDLSSGQIGG